MSIEALAMLGVDYTKVEARVVLSDPWQRDLMKINDNHWQQLMETPEVFDHLPDGNATMEKALKSAKKDPFPSIEVEKTVRHMQNGDNLNTADGNDTEKRMKAELRQWARAVASQVIFAR